MDLAIHRIGFCKYRRPNPFKTAIPTLGDSNDGSRKSSTSGHRPGPLSVAGCSRSSGTSDPMPGTSRNPDLIVPGQVDNVHEELGGESSSSEVPPIDNDVVSPDSTSESAAKSKTVIEPTESSIESGSDQEQVNDHDVDDHDTIEESDSSDGTSYHGTYFTTDDIVKLDSAEDHSYLVAQCINNELTIRVQLVEVRMEEVNERRHSIIQELGKTSGQSSNSFPHRVPKVVTLVNPVPTASSSRFIDPRISASRNLAQQMEAVVEKP